MASNRRNTRQARFNRLGLITPAPEPCLRHGVGARETVRWANGI